MYGIVSKATFLFTNNASKNKIIAVINVNKVTPNPAKIFLNVKNIGVYDACNIKFTIRKMNTLLYSALRFSRARKIK